MLPFYKLIEKFILTTHDIDMEYLTVTLNGPNVKAHTHLLLVSVKLPVSHQKSSSKESVPFG